MGRHSIATLLLLAAGCAEAPVPQAVAPSLPPASIQQVRILNAKKCIQGSSFGAAAPCVIDLQTALKATPEAREFLARNVSQDAPEYYLLLNRANDRMHSAIRKVAGRHGYDVVM